MNTRQLLCDRWAYYFSLTLSLISIHRSNLLPIWAHFHKIVSRFFVCFIAPNSVVPVMSVAFSTLSLYVGALGAAKYLHNSLLASVLRAPMNTFFDVTPLGRILNRFSHDVDVTDTEFPATLRAFTSCFFGVFLFVFLYIKVMGIG